MFPIVKESWIYIVTIGLAVILLFLFRSFAAGTAGLLILLLLIFFFRDPERKIPSGEGLILAPADGAIVRVTKLEGKGGEGDILVSTFLSLLDVHVNRSPVSGVVSGVTYRKGAFRLAYLDEASSENEQNIISLKHGKDSITLKQIAGLIARRVVCWVKPDQEVKAGERIGFIKFGSRVDLILPPGSRIEVHKGDKVKAGLSIIGRLP